MKMWEKAKCEGWRERSECEKVWWNMIVEIGLTAPQLVVGQKAKKKISQSRSYSRRNSLLPPVCRHLASLRLKLKSCSISLKFNQQKLWASTRWHSALDTPCFGVRLHVTRINASTHDDVSRVCLARDMALSWDSQHCCSWRVWWI